MVEIVNYFIPEPEDIRIGYECEMFIMEMNSTIQAASRQYWEKVIVTKENLFEVIHSDLRVPYLTKEQIEAEGFSFIGDNHRMLQFMRWELEINYYPEQHKIHIYETGEKPPRDLFWGECKDINTFRFIKKLSKI